MRLNRFGWEKYANLDKIGRILPKIPDNVAEKGEEQP